MAKLQSNEYAVDKSLDPEITLPELVKKSDVVRWETALKDQLAGWMTDSGSPCEALRQDLRGQQFKKLSSTHANPTEEPATSDPFISSDSVFSLILDLRSSGALPALLFNYDREACEVTVERLLKTLQSAEEKYRNTDPTWIAKIADFEQWKKTRDAAAAKTPKKAATGRRGQDEGLGKADTEREEANREVSKWEGFDPDAPLPQFSFADSTKMSREEFEERLRTMWSDSVRPHFIDALRRGVGVHHAGMNRQYRQV